MEERDRDEWRRRRRKVAERAAQRRRQRHELMAAQQREQRAEEEAEEKAKLPRPPAKRRPPKPVDPEAVKAGCSYPHNTGSTAYSKGCRCRRCQTWRRSQPKQAPRTEYQREYKRKQRQDPEARARMLAANRAWYQRNREAQKAKRREDYQRKKAERAAERSREDDQ